MNSIVAQTLMAERMKPFLFYPSVVRAFDTSRRQGFAKLVSEFVLERHNRFDNKQNVIIDAQVAHFYALASKRRDQLMTSHNRKLRLFLF